MVLSSGSLFGVRSIGFSLLAVIGAGVGIYFAFFSKAGQPYSFSETLPKMISAYGPDARVVQIVADSDSILYEIIARDGRLHRRDYELRTSETSDGGTGYDRHVSNSERRPTRAEQRRAVIVIGDLSPGIVDTLLSRVGFPQDGSSATLTGRTWVLQSGARPFDKYAAEFDGGGLRQTASKATVFGTKRPAAQRPVRTQSAHVRIHTSVVVSKSGGQSGGVQVKAGRLLACVQRAQGDVIKMQDCARRFAP